MMGHLSSVATGEKLSYKDIDLSQPMTFTMSIVANDAVDVGAQSEHCGAITIAAHEVAAWVDGWLSLSKKWKGTFNKGLFQHAGKVAGSFGYETFTQMLGCCGRPRTAQASDVIMKLFDWKMSLIPATASAPSSWNSGLQEQGKRCVFMLVAGRRSVALTNSVAGDA